MNEKSRWKNEITFWYILLVFLFLLSVMLPVIRVFSKQVSFEREVDPELINGLLTASSILFGFSSLVVVSQKPFKRTLWVALLPSLFLIMMSGGAIIDVALGMKNTVEAILWLSATFNVNVVTTAFLVGYTASTVWRKTAKQNSKKNEN